MILLSQTYAFMNYYSLIFYNYYNDDYFIGIVHLVHNDYDQHISLKNY